MTSSELKTVTTNILSKISLQRSDTNAAEIRTDAKKSTHGGQKLDKRHFYLLRSKIKLEPLSMKAAEK